MSLSGLDLVIIFSTFALYLIIGLWSSKKSGQSGTEFFLSGRTMPWWLLGVSMVATTFSADTPNLVTDIVRRQGVAGNWSWWAFLITGMLTVFIYAGLWRRLALTTDLEFYELRYGGRTAAALRGFRALYLGVVFNVIVMGTVCLAGAKIGSVMLGLAPWKTLLLASFITVVYSAVGGLKAVILTDFAQFIIAMIGSVAAAIFVLNLPEIGGLDGLLSHPAVIPKMSMMPDFSSGGTWIPLLLVPLAVQWWSVWYPGAEPGGGGYVAQRMLAARTEKDAVGATLFFNVAHYALRPWPWILVALGSLIVFPDIESISRAFPHISSDLVRHDLAYPAMLSFLPSGLKGLILASLMAALLSTLSTHLNWGAGYVVKDIYVRFLKPNAHDKEQVFVGRLVTVGLMILAALFSMVIESAADGFNLLLQIGAGTGLIFILRWFWMRINGWSELSGMVISFVVALIFFFLKKSGLLVLEPHIELVISVLITTTGWLAVTFLTRPERPEVIQRFKSAIKDEELRKDMRFRLIAIVIATISVYCALFGTGYVLYGQYLSALIPFVTFMAGTYFIVRYSKRIF